MNRDSILTAPDFAHHGEFFASGTIWNMAACLVTKSPTQTSPEGVPLLQSKQYLKQINGTADIARVNNGEPVYFAYKWPTDDDYLERNGLSNNYITTGEGVIGLRAMPGIKIQVYIGTDYTNASGVKMGLASLGTSNHWGGTAPTAEYGTKLYLTQIGQIGPCGGCAPDDGTGSNSAFAIFYEKKGNWVTIELI